MLRATLEDGLVLAQSNGMGWHFLSAVGKWIWEASDAGMVVGQIVTMLADRFGLAPDEISLAVNETLALRQIICQPQLSLPATERVCREPEASEIHGLSAAPSWTLKVCDQAVKLAIDDPVLAGRVKSLVAHLMVNRDAALPKGVVDLGHQIRLWTDRQGRWSLYLDGRLRMEGCSADEALVQIIAALVAVGAQEPNRLLVLHAAGLVSASGCGLVLIGKGGSGKTTLCAALNAQGYRLLSDDVVPVNPDGRLLGLGLSMCVKLGSWAVLQSRLSHLAGMPVTRRFGQAVRYLPPLGPVPTEPVGLRLFLFPQYLPGAEPCLLPLGSSEVLQRILHSESIVTNVTQDKLDLLIRWVGSVPAYALVYPDLDSALALVRKQVATVFPIRQTAEC